MGTNHDNLLDDNRFDGFSRIDQHRHHDLSNGFDHGHQFEFFNYLSHGDLCLFDFVVNHDRLDYDDCFNHTSLNLDRFDKLDVDQNDRRAKYDHCFLPHEHSHFGFRPLPGWRLRCRWLSSLHHYEYLGDHQRVFFPCRSCLRERLPRSIALHRDLFLGLLCWKQEDTPTIALSIDCFYTRWLKLSPVLFVGLFLASGFLFTPALVTPTHAIHNYVEGNWTSYSKVYNVTYPWTQSTLPYVAVSTNGTVTIEDNHSPITVYSVFLNETIREAITTMGPNPPPFYPTISTYGTYHLFFNTTALSTKIVVVKNGTILQKIQTNPPMVIGAVAISADGHFIVAVGQAVPAEGGKDNAELFVGEGTPAPTLSGSCPAGKYLAGITTSGTFVCLPLPTVAGGPSSCMPSLGYICQNSTTTTSTHQSATLTNSTSGGNMTAPPAIAYPLTALVLAIVIGSIFVYRRIRGENEPRTLLGRGSRGSGVRARIRRAFS